MEKETKYDFKSIEQRWQTVWQDQEIFKVKSDQSLKKYYVLEMFPYPSGRIHMGHVRNYTIGDVIARYKRSQGYNVLHPMGWDAFGLPAENAAIDHNIHPASWTINNINDMRQRLKSIGLSYDWDYELTTCLPEYYLHEQKIFLDFYQNKLAYRKEATVNWDPIDQTVLANEQVIDGKGWRSGAIVEQKKLKQWFLKITDFAEELLQGLDTLTEWPNSVKSMQEKWIGRSEGLKISFQIKEQDFKLEIFTTRAETIFGATFIAISPNHPLANLIAKNNPEAVDFIDKCNNSSVSEASIEAAPKLGFNTNIFLIHPLDNSYQIPLYIANFVLLDYGSGAIFGCPAHDRRDFEFAKQYNIAIKEVIKPVNAAADIDYPYLGDGIMINSSLLDDLSITEAREKISQHLINQNLAQPIINYRLRDWGISRQRYWGCPIPIIYCPNCGVVPVPIEQLPVTLPIDVEFTSSGNPLENHPTWKHTQCPNCQVPAIRETDTFDTFFESSWYFIRFCNPKINEVIDQASCKQFLPVDQYIGGIEHAVLHLLYARFFTKALQKCGYDIVSEPFKGLLTQGMVSKETYQDENKNWLYPEEVIKNQHGYFHHLTHQPVKVGRVEKMSKSKKNVVDPEQIIAKYGVDTARLFMLSDSPPERNLDYSESGIEGSYRYIKRIIQLVEKINNYQNDELSNIQYNEIQIAKIKNLTNRSIYNVTEDLNKLHFNKAIARIREFSNSLFELEIKSEQQNFFLKEQVKILLCLLQPFIPHITQELWSALKEANLLVLESWPIADLDLLKEEHITLAVQLNGKLKTTMIVRIDLSDEELKHLTFELPQIKAALINAEPKKIIIIPNKIINIVI